MVQQIRHCLGGDPRESELGIEAQRTHTHTLTFVIEYPLVEKPCVCCAHPSSRARVCLCHVLYTLPARTPSLRQRVTRISKRDAYHPEERTRPDPERPCALPVWSWKLC